MGFTEDAADMDQTVDALLGDDIQVKFAGQNAYTTISGFVVNEERAQAFGEIDLGGNNSRIKVSKLVWPTVSKYDRIKCPLIGSATYAPMDAEPFTAGRYWIFEVQNASTNT